MSILAKSNEFLESLYQTRANNLREIAKQYKQDKQLAELLGISPGRLHNLIRKAQPTFSEKMARAIEQRLNLELESLDQSSNEINKNKIPVYLLEDLRDFEGATPSNSIYYEPTPPNAYFVQILNKVYEPHIPMGTKILINPNAQQLKNGKLFMVGYNIDNSIKPVIRLYDNNTFIDFITQEEESLNNYQIYGTCETVISPLNLR